jgi:DNA-binding Xre family transcriptional regulator
MDILMTHTTSSALADFLDREFKKRVFQDRTFSLRQWAKEIGIDHSLLNRMINGKNKGPKQISIEVLNKLILYFGPEILSILGIVTTDKPKNPAYSMELSFNQGVAEKPSPYTAKRKEGK